MANEKEGQVGKARPELVKLVDQALPKGEHRVDQRPIYFLAGAVNLDVDNPRVGAEVDERVDEFVANERAILDKAISEFLNEISFSITKIVGAMWPPVDSLDAARNDLIGENISFEGVHKDIKTVRCASVQVDYG